MQALQNPPETIMDKKAKKTVDDDIRQLVIARLSVLSADTIKSIGDKGSFSRDELIQHVKKGDEIGKIITNVEMEWLRALKNITYAFGQTGNPI